MEKVFIHGPTATDTTASGRTATFMAKELRYAKVCHMLNYSSYSLLHIRPGGMIIAMRANGAMTSRMAMV